MNGETAFVGDVHGNLLAIRGIVRELRARPVEHVVFLGDYINKGQESAEVLDELLDLAQAGWATLLAGNHEHALISALDNGDVAPFLRIGGAATIRSYVGARVGPHPLEELRACMPSRHIEALRAMGSSYQSADIVATHMPAILSGEPFTVTAHAPVGPLPVITATHARIDTGCGSPLGRLTALLWPSRRFIQVDDRGRPVI